MRLTQQRQIKLMKDDSLELTQEEIDAGIHFCADWDGLVIDPLDPEFLACTCFPTEERMAFIQAAKANEP